MKIWNEIKALYQLNKIIDPNLIEFIENLGIEKPKMKWGKKGILKSLFGKESFHCEKMGATYCRNNGKFGIVLYLKSFIRLVRSYSIKQSKDLLKFVLAHESRHIYQRTNNITISEDDANNFAEQHVSLPEPLFSKDDNKTIEFHTRIICKCGYEIWPGDLIDVTVFGRRICCPRCSQNLPVEMSSESVDVITSEPMEM